MNEKIGIFILVAIVLAIFKYIEMWRDLSDEQRVTLRELRGFPGVSLNLSMKGVSRGLAGTIFIVMTLLCVYLGYIKEFAVAILVISAGTGILGAGLTVGTLDKFRSAGIPYFLVAMDVCLYLLFAIYWVWQLSIIRESFTMFGSGG